MRALALRTAAAAFPGPTAPPWALRLVAEGSAGIVLFPYNIADADQLAAAHRVTARGPPRRAAVATDEEGGDVTRLRPRVGQPVPGQRRARAWSTTSDADRPDLPGDRRRSCAAVGFTLDLAPAVDVNSADDNPVIGTRSLRLRRRRGWPRTPPPRSTGLQSVGVAACAKHFPGHGATELDSHHDLPLVDALGGALWLRELAPVRGGHQGRGTGR